MAYLRKTLPPPNSLVAFEAAGRHLNFTRAAEELRVTQAAVSRQILLLEDFVGCSLFLRRHRSLELTSSGKVLFQAVSMGLQHIANTSRDIATTRTSSKAVTISTSVAFASYWLMSRIATFRAAHKDIDLRLVASAPVHNLTAAGIDFAVRYGSGSWVGVKSIHMFDNEIWPVCSPSYLEGRDSIKSMSDLLNETLLHLSQFDRNWVTWPAWLASHGVTQAPTPGGLEFDSYTVLIQAALGGQGVALCGRRLAEDFLRRGELVRPLAETMTSQEGFFLIYPKDLPLSAEATLFKDWILKEAHGE